MLGNSAFRLFSASEGFQVTGTVRGTMPRQLAETANARLITDVNATDQDRLVRLMGEVQPDVVINCVGVIKQLSAAEDSLVSIALNALFPHRLAELCALVGARLVHMSTDCVFDGRKGDYTEADPSNAEDLYGKSKFLGEVDYPNAVTLRTSIIGHELTSAHSLIDWFLSQPGPSVKGYRKAIYTGLPTVEIARIIRDVVIPDTGLRGVWHVAADKINKYDLLTVVASVYGKLIEIVPDDGVVIDRSLDGTRFRKRTGYVAPPWPELVARMHAAR